LKEIEEVGPMRRQIRAEARATIGALSRREV
jgi:hypothetical protein